MSDIEIGGIECEEYKNNLTLTLGIDKPVRFAMTNDGKKLFEPEEYKGKKHFSGYLIIEDKKEQEALVEIIEYLGGKLSEGLPEDPDYIALKNGDDCIYSKGENKGEVYEGFAGHMAVKFKRREDEGAPEVYSEQGDLIESYPDKRVYHDGSYGRAQIRFFAYENSNGSGIGCDIVAVLYTDKGERIVSKGGGGGTDKAALFKGRKQGAGKDERNSVFGKKK